MPLGTRPPATDGCGECRDWPDALTWARSATLLGSPSPSDRLVHALKYGGWKTLAAFMAERMTRVTLPPVETAVVVPVPTTRARRRRRGYNQAEVLAGAYADLTGRTPVDALRRRAGARTQVSLQPRERRHNVRQAFTMRPKGRDEIEGKRVILVDDVLTTGATAASAARALTGAGAECVCLLTFARAVPYRGTW